MPQAGLTTHTCQQCLLIKKPQNLDICLLEMFGLWSLQNRLVIMNLSLCNTPSHRWRHSPTIACTAYKLREKPPPKRTACSNLSTGLRANATCTINSATCSACHLRILGLGWLPCRVQGGAFQAQFPLRPLARRLFVQMHMRRFLDRPRLIGATRCLVLLPLSLQKVSSPTHSSGRLNQHDSAASEPILRALQAALHHSRIGYPA
jgi:hypothetical protein